MESIQTVSDVQLLEESLEPLPEPVAEPVLIVVSGLPGTGKSYFCGKLAERLPLLVLESDTLRQKLFPMPSYTAEESAWLFQAIHQLIAGLLRRGISLALDATNLSEQFRERLYSIADRQKARLIIVRVEAPPEIAYQRLQARVDKINPADKSDADWQVYQKMKSTVQKIQRNHYAVDTSRDITPVLDKIVRAVKR
ncbi:AAA family ATPase [Chloroflexota bacterium]